VGGFLVIPKDDFGDAGDLRGRQFLDAGDINRL
jgi:hypothetical protein